MEFSVSFLIGLISPFLFVLLFPFSFPNPCHIKFPKFLTTILHRGLWNNYFSSFPHFISSNFYLDLYSLFFLFDFYSSFPFGLYFNFFFQLFFNSFFYSIVVTFWISSNTFFIPSVLFGLLTWTINRRVGHHIRQIS